jgi:iron(III) transport system permease protein
MIPGRWGRGFPAGGLLLALALAVVLGWPGAALVLEAARGTSLAETARGLMDTALAGAAGRPLGLAAATLRVTLGAEALALPAGIALAVLLFRTDLWGRRLLLGLLALALFVPMPLHATAWLGAIGNVGRLQALGGRPLLTGWTGAAFVHALAALPWVVLLAGVGLRSVETEAEESALLEMPARRVVVRVTLRRSLGALAAAALAVAVLTAGDMTVTDLLQVRTYAEEAYIQSQLGEGPAAAAKVAIPPLLVLGGAILAGARALGRWDPARLVSSREQPRTWRLGRGRVPLGLAVVLLVGAVLAVPIYGLIWRAGRVSGRAAGGLPPHWSLGGLVGTLARAWPDVAEPSALVLDPLRSPLLSSTLGAALGATFAVILGWPLAWKARRPGMWAAVAAGVVALLLAAPGPIVGLALKLAFLRVPAIHDTGAIVVLAYVARTLPYVVLILWPALRAIPPAHLEVAAVEGYAGWRLAGHVAAPLARPAIAAAWGVAFVLALGELPASHLVLPPGWMTVSARVWMLLHTGVESHLAGVGLILLIFYGAMSWGASQLLRRAGLRGTAGPPP